VTTPGKVPYVTVLVSCYNAERWLTDALDSVLAQTFADFELLVVDDGSTDATAQLIARYAAVDKRVVGVRKSNTGLTSSLNHGLSLARGEWIARMDADDLSEPTRLAEQVDFVTKHTDVVLLGTGFIEIDSSGQAITKHLYPASHARLVFHLEHLGRFFPHSSAFFRSSEAKRANGYNVRLQRAQDWRLWLDLARWGRIASLRNPLVKIRKHAGQISLSSNGTRQLFDATAGTVGHLLRKRGYRDPCAEGNKEEWATFLQWIEAKVLQSGFLERQGIWNEARSRLFQTDSGLRGRLAFGKRLVTSGHALTSVGEHLFGPTLPQQLTRDWIKEKCAVS
jgi:glycosyltransferase involved in cell wall biosynthesis